MATLRSAEFGFFGYYPPPADPSIHKLDNLTAFTDYNKLQGDGPVKKIMDLEPLADKWRAFNWAVTEIDGNDIGEIVKAVEWALGVKGKPQMIISHTVKGKGVSFMENQCGWHGKAPNQEEFERALAELEKGLAG